MNFQSKDSERRMRPKFSSRVPSASGQTRKPSTPIPSSPYLTTTQLMAKIRNSASTSVSDQITKVMEARNQATSKSRGSGRPQSKSSRELSNSKDSSTLDFNRDRSRIFAQIGSFEKSAAAKALESLQMANTQLISPFRPKKVNSSRGSRRKSISRSKENNPGQNLPELANDKDKSEPYYPPPTPNQFKNLGMGDTPALVNEVNSIDSKETLVAEPTKSILKVPAHCPNEGFGPTKLKNRIVLSDEDMFRYESATWQNGFTARRIITPKPKSDKKVRFEEEVKVHSVPYEARGSTEWQHNLLLSREMMLQRFLTDPRLGLFPDIFGTKSHPVASMHEAFDLSPKPKPHHSMNPTRPPRPTPRFPRSF